MRPRRLFPNAPALLLLALVGCGPPVTTPDESRSVPEPELAVPQLPSSTGHRVPFVPTPDPVVEAMLELAGVAPGDRVLDLGSGDGRLVLASAERGAAARGIELRADLVDASRRHAFRSGFAHRVDFVQGDILDTDWGDPTVVMAYLSPELMSVLATRLRTTLAPGTRVVSHAFDIPGWRPERELTIERWGGRTTRLYLWQVGEVSSAAAQPGHASAGNPLDPAPDNPRLSPGG